MAMWVGDELGSVGREGEEADGLRCGSSVGRTDVGDSATEGSERGSTGARRVTNEMNVVARA